MKPASLLIFIFKNGDHVNRDNSLCSAIVIPPTLLPPPPSLGLGEALIHDRDTACSHLR